MGLRQPRDRLCSDGGGEPALQNRVDQDQAIRTGVTASAIAHLTIVALLVLMSEVHPLGSSTESIAVDIVTPQEVEAEKPKAEVKPEVKAEEPQLKLPETSVFDQKAASQQSTSQQSPSKQPPSKQQSAAAASSPAAAPAQAASAAPQAAAPQQAPKPQQSAASGAAPPAQLGAALPGYKPPEPDLSVKYNVVLGLPIDAAPMANPGKSDDGFDATASDKADISSSVIEQFRKHLKSCSKLPASVQPSDHIMVKLRVMMTRDGRLVADPAIGGGSANIKAIEMLQSAIAALKQCQPYKMLPVDRYGEWRVLDLEFTPKDFSG
jgi:outer membrane biosynthesis protein TonB